MFSFRFSVLTTIVVLLLFSTRQSATPPADEPINMNGTGKPLPPIKFVNHPKVDLMYELTKVGKTGIGSLELWWTKNDGQTWELYTTMYPEYRGSEDPKGQQRCTVELAGEGVYGLTLVVKNRVNVGKNPPRAGDVPAIRIEVDTTPPLAELFEPINDPLDPDALILNWAAKDKNLGSNPIFLEWAKSREGPWQLIAGNLANTGKYSWKIPENLPVQVHLRLRVCDLADNESTAVTAELQVIDLSTPEVKLIGVIDQKRRK